MSEEELNQELSTDELKDVAGGLNQGLGKYLRSDKGKDALVKGDLPLETDTLIGKKGKKRKNPSVIFPGNDEYDQG